MYKFLVKEGSKDTKRSIKLLLSNSWEIFPVIHDYLPKAKSVLN